MELEKKLTELQTKIISEQRNKDLRKEHENKNKKLEPGSLTQREELKKQINNLEKNNENITKEIGSLKKKLRLLVSSRSAKINDKKRKKY